MLTFRVGVSGSAAGGKAMAQYLLDSAIPREQAVAAAKYFAQPVPVDEVARVNTVFAELVTSGTLTRDEALEALVDHEQRQAAPKAGRGLEAVARVYARLVEGGSLDYNDAMQSLMGRVLPQFANHADPWLEAEERAAVLFDAGAAHHGEMVIKLGRTLDVAIAKAAHERDYAGAVPETRRDMHPKLADALGIDPGRVVSTTELAHLLSGQRADGEDIARKQRQGATDKKRKLAFIDLTLSPDKSLSVAWALAPTEGERAVLLQAHKDAVASTMGHIGTQLGHMRIGKGGLKGTEQGHVGWVSVDHHTARPVAEIAAKDATGQGYTQFKSVGTSGDPQIHTHTLLLSTVVTDSGRVGSVDLDAIAGRVKEWGGLYEAHLATNLRRSGVDVVLDKETGSARLTGVPDAVRSRFSKRTQDGTTAARDAAKKEGVDWDGLSANDKADLIDRSIARRREAKANDGGSDLAGWRAEAGAMGYTHKSVMSSKPKPMPDRDARLEHARDVSLTYIDQALRNNAKLNGQELRVAAARGLVAAGIDTAADIDAVTKSYRERGVVQDGQRTALAWGYERTVRGKARIGVTTALHVSQERELVALAKSAATDRSGALPPALIQAAVSRREAMPLDAGGLRFGTDHGKAQREVMDSLGTGGRFSVAIGIAGSGKSSLLAPLVDAWRENGRQVYGAALAWRQADALEGAGIKAQDRRALNRLIKDMERGKLVPDSKSVVVVDEIGLVGTRQLLDLLRLQKQHGFSIVAVGDPKQAAAVEAGPVIDILRTALGSKAIPELRSSIRQQTPRERETATMLREGNAAEALERKREDGTAVLVAGPYQAAVQRVAQLWRERTEANPAASITVSAPTNTDARAISEAIRVERRAMGQLGPDVRMIKATDQAGGAYALPLAVGDRVRLFDRTQATFADKGTRGLIGNNGSVLEVRAVTNDGITLRTATGREGVVAWASLRDKENGRTRLTYGDVLTVDAAQGLTSTEHIAAMPGGTQGVSSGKAYVGGSRHTEQSWVVIGDAAERREVRTKRAVNDARPITEADVWKNAAANLSRQRDVPSALAFMSSAADIRRGTVRTMQGSFQRTEARALAGLSPTRLRQRAQSVRVAAHERVQAFQRRVANVVRDAMTALRPDTEQRRSRMRM